MGIKKNGYMNDGRKENAYIVHSYVHSGGYFLGVLYLKNHI